MASTTKQPEKEPELVKKKSPSRPIHEIFFLSEALRYFSSRHGPADVG
jgi:hypothetical protein